MKKRDELEKLRGMSDEDLQEEVARIKESLFRLNFKLALGEMDTVKRMRQEKRTLARLQTLMTQRQSEQAVQGK
jgi:large subunit ribosomal protein L29